MKKKVLKVLNLDNSKLDDKAEFFMKFFESLGVKFVDVTPRKNETKRTS